MKWIAASLVFLAPACTQQQGNGYNRFLAACNRVDIVVYNNGDSPFFDTQDSTGIRMLTGQITGNTHNIKDTCAALGVLRLKSDSTLLLEAPFAVTPGTTTDTCNYLSYAYGDDSYVERLNERTRKLLATVLQQARK